MRGGPVVLAKCVLVLFGVWWFRESDPKFSAWWRARVPLRCQRVGHRTEKTLSGSGGTSGMLDERECGNMHPGNPAMWPRNLEGGMLWCDLPSPSWTWECPETGWGRIGRWPVETRLGNQEQRAVKTWRRQVSDVLHCSLDQEVLDKGVPDLPLWRVERTEISVPSCTQLV